MHKYKIYIVVGIVVIGCALYGVVHTVHSIDLGHTNIIDTIILEHYRHDILHNEKALLDSSTYTIERKNVYINEDNMIDMSAVVKAPETCGSGGCITTLFIQQTNGGYIPVNFQYALKSLRVLDSMTNGMHDIEINDTKNAILTWDGTMYQPNY